MVTSIRSLRMIVASSFCALVLPSHHVSADALIAANDGSAADAKLVTSGSTLPPGFTSKFAKADGIKMHYVEGGTGPAVILLHGWPQTWRAWRKVMPLLAVNYRIIAIDMPGLGESGLSGTGYDKLGLARHIHSLVLTLGLKHVAVVGHDLGASVAYGYAKQFVNEVDKLVVMDDPIAGLGDWDEVRGRWPRWHFAFHNIPELPEQLVSGREYNYLSWFYKNAYQKDAISEDDARIYAAAYARPESLHAGFEYYRAFEKDAADNRADATPITMPVLAIGGDHSPYKTLLYEQLKGQAVSLQGDVAPNCGHFIAEEQPEWLADRLRKFLN